MIRICVAIILVAVIKTSAKPPIKEFQSSISSRQDNPLHIHTASSRERTHKLASDSAHEVHRSRNLFYRPKLFISKPLNPKFDIPLDSRKQPSDGGSHESEKFNQGYVNINPDSTTSGYSSSKTVKSHLPPPLEISTKSVFYEHTDESELYEDLSQKHHERKITEYSDLKPKINEEYAVTISTDSSKSAITEYGNPKLTFEIPKIERMQHYRSLVHETSKSLPTIFGKKKYFYGAPKPQKNLSDSYETPSIRTPYESQKDFNYGIGIPKSIEQLEPLKNIYNAMHSVDSTYGDPRNINNVYKTSKGIRHINGIPRNNVNPRSDNSQFKTHEKYSNNNHRTETAYSEHYNLNQKSDSIYSSPKSNTNYAKDFDISFKNLGDSFEEHASIASKHTGKPKDQQFGQSRLDDVDDSFQDYDSQNFGPTDYKDYDQTYRLQNGQDSGSFESDELNGYDAARPFPVDYESPGSESSHTNTRFSDFVATKSSPGLTGVTQAITRNHSPAVQSIPRNSLGHGSRHILPEVRENNDDPPPPHRHQAYTKNNHGQKAWARSDKHIFKSGQSHSYGEGGFGGYELNVPAVYGFEYAVSDDRTESRYGHWETREHERAKGSYHVLLPDGRKQIVEYEADERGFKPTITYEEPAPSNGYDLGSVTKKGYNENKQNYNKNHKYEERNVNVNDEKIYRNNQYGRTDGDIIEESAFGDLSNNSGLERNFEDNYEINTSTAGENTGEYGSKFNVRSRS